MEKITIEKSRKWLENNKVFFEVFSYVFLGIASLLVGYFSYVSSKSQLEILKLEHSPLISIKREFKGDSEFLKLHNVGYHLFEPKVNYFTYFIIKDYKNSEIKNETDFYFRIDDYFGFSYETDNTIGNIASIITSSFTNFHKKRIIEECKSLFGNNFQIGLFEHLIEITFKDENKKLMTKYYKIDSFSVIEISKKIYYGTKTKYDTHNLNGNKFLNEIKAQEILQEIEKIYKKI